MVNDTDLAVRAAVDGLGIAYTIEDLVDLPSMHDPTTRATLDVLTAVLPPAMFTDENLFSLAICRMANLSLARGVTLDRLAQRTRLLASFFAGAMDDPCQPVSR